MMSQEGQQILQDQAVLHQEECVCQLCAKQLQIRQIKKMRANLHLQSSYKSSFHSSISKEKKKSIAGKRRSDSSLPITSYSYLDLQSTYGNDFLGKKGEVVKFRPKDNIIGLKSNGPISTTYLQSYYSTLTPKPDQPIRSPEMPVGNGLIAFSSEQQHRMKPSLPIIQRQCLSLPKSLGPTQTTQKNSYIEHTNTQKKQNPMIKPIPNLVNLSPFAHNFDTTYRNYFVGQGRKLQAKHDVDEIGNINWKFHRKNIRNVQNPQFCTRS